MIKQWNIPGVTYPAPKKKEAKHDYRRFPKAQLKVTEIPSGYIIQKEAREILGINNLDKRLGHLPTLEVRYNGYRHLLYKRDDVEKQVYKPMPEGYITSKEACKIMGICEQSVSLAQVILRKHNVPCVWVEAHHSY